MVGDRATLFGIAFKAQRQDDLVITEDGFENLTAAIPKTVDDVESWMRG